MRSHRTALLGLLGIGFLLCASNVWIAARRSLIPLEVDAVIHAKDLRAEKHPGVDDVCMLNMGDKGWYQVDRSVWEAVNDGDRISKPAWTSELTRADETVALSWSKDTVGLARCMPLAFAILFAMAIHLWLHPVREEAARDTAMADLRHPD